MKIAARQIPNAALARSIAMLLLLCAPMLAPPNLYAQASKTNSQIVALNKKLRIRGDLTLTDTTLRQALFTISKTWGINLVVGDAVDGSVNGVFQDAPLNEILDALLLANGYGYRQVGQSLVVMPIAKIGETNPLFETATISLKRIDAKDAISGSQMLISPQGRVHSIPSANSVLVVDFPDRVERVREFLRLLDAAAASSGSATGSGRITAVQFSPQYIKAEDLQQSLETLLGSQGKITSIARENRVVIVDSPEVIARAREIMRQIDIPRRQVRITALVYDMSVEDVETLGVNWKHAAKGRPDASGNARSLFSFDSLMQAPTAAGSPAGVMTFMNLSSSFDFTSVIAAMNTASDSRLLADPTIMVVDREQATIQIVQEIPYQQLTQTGLGGNIGTTAFREAGVTLDVTPRIANDSTIQIDVTPTFSILAGFTTGATPQPIIDKREAHTVVRVADRQTLVIGGLRQRSEINSRRGIPKLKDIRKFGIGKLFKSYKKSMRESELVVFLYCEIVGPCTVDAPRNVAAHEQSRFLLDQIPAAEFGPQCAPPAWAPEAVYTTPMIETIQPPNGSTPPGDGEWVEPRKGAVQPPPAELQREAADSESSPLLAPHSPQALLQRLPSLEPAGERYDVHMTRTAKAPPASKPVLIVRRVERSTEQSPVENNAALPPRHRTYPPPLNRKRPSAEMRRKQASSSKKLPKTPPKTSWYKRVFAF